ncbi:YeeE/YedE family protein [Kocuria turfanensis]|uniref:Membrane protein n=1 Tax=Kocuria turfanensis TaxID=388357 RepID=A0A512I9C8_9MICC|nr:YeeE/YedE family protein [Kocuria turfanensis]GEO94309.1 membrane protein [Kocuria turfanensis]
MLISGLLIGAALGFVLQRGRFCVTGAFRDVWIAKNTWWLSALFVAIAVQSVGVWVLDALGVITLSSTGFAWLATIVGGFVFGFGIVLAGGCATGTYYRAGEGLVGSWFALLFYALFAAISKYGPLAGTTQALRGITTEHGTIHETLHVSPWILVALLVAVAALWARHHLTKPRMKVATLPPERTGLNHLLFEKAWNPFATAVVIGLIALAAWPASWATGREFGLGITGPSANIANYLTTGDLEMVDWGVLLVVGILVGSFIAAKGSGEFKIRVPDAQTIVRSIAGGALMGIGAAWAGGCTIGNGLVETSMFSWQGWIGLGAMILGTGAAAKIFIAPRKKSAAPGRVPAGV